MRNKFKEFKILEEERKYFNELNETKEGWVDWYYRNENAFGKRFTELVDSFSKIERYIANKRKRIYVPESLTNPFFLEYQPVNALHDTKKGVINFKVSSRRKPELELSGKCKKEYETIISMVNEVNKDRTNPNKYEVYISPIRQSLRGKPVNNTFAMKIIFPDGSVCCFFHILGKYHIATNVAE